MTPTQSITPRTDALEAALIKAGDDTPRTIEATMMLVMRVTQQLLALARKLETELSEAKRDALNCRQIIDTYSRQDDDLCKLRTDNEALRRHVEELTETRRLNGNTICQIDKERTQLRDQLAECAKDKERLGWFVKWIWESRWVSDESLYQEIVGRAAEIRSGNYNGIDSAISAAKGPQ